MSANYVKEKLGNDVYENAIKAYVDPVFDCTFETIAYVDKLKAKFTSAQE